MKKQIFTSLLLLPVIYCFSQKHVKGMNEIAIGGGKTDLGIYGEIGYHKVLSSKFKLGASLVLEEGKYKTIKFSSTYLQPELRYCPFNIGETFFLNLGAGLVLNYNSINLSNTVENATSKKGINYGGELFIEPEIYLTETVIFYGIVRRYWVTDKILGTTILTGGIGIKLSF